MKLSLVPMLQVERELYEIPRGWTRFEKYLQVLTGGTDEVVLPLVALNPMGKENVPVILDALLALGAEEIAASALAEAERRLAGLDGDLRVGLVVADDAQGGWTNRYFTEMQHRFEKKGDVKRGWVVAIFWTSEEPTREKVREEVMAAVYRIAYFMRHGPARTLRQMIAQEGLAAAFAEARGPTLDPNDLAYTREVIQPYLDSTHFPTAFACLYGDQAAQSVGYPTLGFSPRAGYALALVQALDGETTPEGALRGWRGT